MIKGQFCKKTRPPSRRVPASPGIDRPGRHDAGCCFTEKLSSKYFIQEAACYFSQPLWSRQPLREDNDTWTV